MNPIIIAIGLGLAAAPPPQPPPSGAGSLRPEPGWKEMGPSLWFDPQGRRAILRARVVLRDGMLEHLMCRKGTKEHEAIVATEAPPRLIHAALLLTGADVGHPVEFAPKFRPPAGAPIAIEMVWNEDGRRKTDDARRWVRDEKTEAPLDIDWVFAGSVLYEDRISRKPMYAADDGDLITVANFASAILDLPIASSASDTDRMFTANTGRIPPIGTEIFMILRPRRPEKAGGSEKGRSNGDRPSPPPSKSNDHRAGERSEGACSRASHATTSRSASVLRIVASAAGIVTPPQNIPFSETQLPISRGFYKGPRMQSSRGLRSSRATSGGNPFYQKNTGCLASIERLRDGSEEKTGGINGAKPADMVSRPGPEDLVRSA